MSRLIDADALIEVIKKYKFGAISNESEREYTREIMLCFVNGSSTAYDIEKVEEQLDEYITKIVGRKSALYQTIMRIVRKGGAE